MGGYETNKLPMVMAKQTTKALGQDFVDGLMGMPVAIEPGKPSKQRNWPLTRQMLRVARSRTQDWTSKTRFSMKFCGNS